MTNETAPPHGRPPQDLPHIVFLSSSDPLDIRSFSTVLLHMVGALRRQFPDMEIVRNSRPRWFRRFQLMVGAATGNRVDPYHWTRLNRWFAARLLRGWRGRRIVVISVVNATLAAELAGAVPVINVSDSTFVLMRSFYASFERLAAASARSAAEAEQRAIRQSVHNCFSSSWAARSAIEDYGAPPADVSVIPWGCNLDYVTPDRARLTTGADPWRLLFIGGEWQRKGGDIVLETFQLLRARGLPITLDIVGPGPVGGVGHLLGVTAHGFLSKGDPAQSARLNALYRDAEFLFLPTRQDCTPMVFAEANAHGTPGLTRDVGGVGGVVRDGDNGYLLPSDASAERFADTVERAFRDREANDRLRRSSRRAYEERLNWPAWAARMREIVEALAAGGRI